MISENTSIGKGSVVMYVSVINSGAQIGRGVIVNTSASVDHDCIVGDWCHIAVECIFVERFISEKEVGSELVQW